ncbi:MAG: peptide-methionine (S)-S-oxide reductase MsrA [Gemmatimonadota bacterium]|nr:MAG: peptide-methionine (S)-S-oxide reductase MsrA [Gemmatimonadota bacterium]
MTEAGEDTGPSQVATFAAGCFWKPEQVFSEIAGVVATSVGFMGGTVEEPTYEQVCSTATGHAEVVHLEYDPGLVSYDELLAVFWDIHDPTQLNRQGADVGTQYRSAIFYHSDEQEQAALASLAALEASGRHSGAVVTEIIAAADFFRAEEYHQRFFDKRSGKNPII